MSEVSETVLPGVGVRHEFTTVDGERVAVLTHRGGRREIAVADRDDPDASASVVHLSSEDARTLSEILGATQVTEATNAVQQQIEGLAIEWLTVQDRSAAAGRSIAEGGFRTRTGCSIVAILRGTNTVPAPGPGAILELGDVAVAVGTAAGLDQLRALMAP